MVEAGYYTGLAVLGGLILLVVIGIIMKEIKRRKMVKVDVRERDEISVPLPDDINIEDIDNVEFFKHPDARSTRDVTTDAIRLLKQKRNVIRADIIKERRNMFEELKKVKQTQVEIYSMIELLISYYKDLKKKERILHVSVTGLVENGK